MSRWAKINSSGRYVRCSLTSELAFDDGTTKSGNFILVHRRHNSVGVFDLDSRFTVMPEGWEPTDTCSTVT